MLKDKYIFIHTKKSAEIIVADYKQYLRERPSPINLLCAMNLGKFLTKLGVHSLSSGKSQKKISMNQREALAFYIAYKNGCLNTSCPFVLEMFMAIDRSIHPDPEADASQRSRI